MVTIDTIYERVYLKVAPHLNARRWVVGLSGGIDSVVILHVLNQLPIRYPGVQFPPVHAMHINHQLQPDAESWELFCAEYAQQMGVSYQSIKVNVTLGASLEDQARKARYQAFSQAIHEDDLLMLAHHQDDQMETFLFRLFRGAGVRGLMSIAPDTCRDNIHIVRPALEISKQAMIDYAKHAKLSWVEDSSNQSFAFDRNYIRQYVVPAIRERWSTVSQSIERTIQHLVEADALLNEFAADDLATLGCGEENGEAWMAMRSAQLSAKRLKNACRYFFQCHHVVLSDKQWTAFLNDVVNASQDAMPELICGDTVIRRYRARIYLCHRTTDDWQVIEWKTDQPISVPGYGRLALSPPPVSSSILTLRRREPGLVVRPQKRGATSKKLKKILQELSIPPWRRDFIPVVFAGDTPIAIANLLVLEGADTVLKGSQIVCTK